MNKLVNGKIPAGQPCPFFNRCRYAQTNCPNDKLLKESPFSCKQSRQFDALEEASLIGETSVKGKAVDNKIDWDKIKTCLPLMNTQQKRDLVFSDEEYKNLEIELEKANLAGGNVSMNDVKQLAFNIKSASERAKLKGEITELETLNSKMAEILNATTNALKGKPPKLTRYSWHDLPKVAKKKMKKIKKLKRKLRNANY